jgi:hypothetical protein
VVSGAVNSVNKIPLRLFERVNQSQLSVVLDHLRHVHQWPIPEFSAPFSHTTATHNIITIYMAQSAMNLGRGFSFCMKKTDLST